ncbi:choice-of-anchor X domain-containing protein [Chroococcidiopsis sp. CCNUC1]|uniref:choice-of-anchor X domain-containing protein n=1 Tax=Chroococcidiopsis sp. CCNUC1 TaxID=2653189 RepID=UPI000D05B3B2|nr:choice-of-anchor X domain-containing protein [Chroococcidiopsis sp. CCNUC1]PSB49032.1 hypothetical protein C7B80_03500 [Cyanosarcina cf. burmensis CCALA 770]URD47722.1 hypothetical protein M5J74_15405 [Chroococcidiopsis sp. CCNUC1]
MSKLTKKTSQIIGALLVFAVIISLPASAQTENPQQLIDFSRMQEQERKNYILKASNHRIEGTVIIDDASEINLLFGNISKNTEIELISPNSERFSKRTQNNSKFQSIFFSFSPDSESTVLQIFKLFNPLPGKWKYVIQQKVSTDAQQDIKFTLLTDSTIFAGIQGAREENWLNSNIRLELAALENRNPIQKIAINAVIQRLGDRTLQKHPLQFRDDGLNGDRAVNDGIFTTSIKAREPGEFLVNANIEGKTSKGNLFQRHVFTDFKVIRRTARLLKSFSDRGIDTNGDGLFDRIVISPAIRVLEAGEYFIKVTLKASNSESFFQNTRVKLPIGNVSPEIEFDTEDIKEYLKVDAPYQVSEVFLEGDAYALKDRVINLGNTKAYKIAQFQREAILLNGSAKPVGIDINNNGKFDYLDVTIPVNFLYSGAYKWSASLATKDRTVINLAAGEGSFAAGDAQLKLRFNGAAIGDKKLPPPYIIQGFIVYGGSRSLNTDDDLPIPSFTAAQFEGFIPDREPPKISFSVEPTILKPADDRLVEIKVNAQVSDNIDPNPSHRIGSITTNDGQIVRGDRLTSEDIEINSDGRVFLRAKSKNGQPRIYTITYTARDSAGNLTQTSAEVKVSPEDK